jgi:hypothetical protein
VRQSQELDSSIDKTWASAERALWYECRELRHNLKNATNGSECSDEQFKILMRGRLQEIESRASTVMDNRTLAYALQEKTFHKYRRQLAIIYGEIEMCDLSLPVRRTVDQDGAYIAHGRQCVKLFYRQA